MTVSDLIAKLQTCPPDAVVYAWSGRDSDLDNVLVGDINPEHGEIVIIEWADLDACKTAEA